VESSSVFDQVPEWLNPDPDHHDVVATDPDDPPLTLRLNLGYPVSVKKDERKSDLPEYSGPYDYLVSRWRYFREQDLIQGAVSEDFDDSQSVGTYDWTPWNTDPSRVPIANAPYGLTLVRDLQESDMFFYGSAGTGPLWGDLKSTPESEWRAFFRVATGEPDDRDIAIPISSLRQYEHTTSPRVIAFKPGDGAINVPPDSPIIIHFDAPIARKTFLFRVEVNGETMSGKDLKDKWLNDKKVLRIDHPDFPKNALVGVYVVYARNEGKYRWYLEGVEFLGAYTFGWRSRPDELFLYHRHKYAGRPYRSDVACSLTNINNRMMQVGFANRFGYPPDRVLLAGKGMVMWVKNDRKAIYPPLSSDAFWR
jgi:hypothetical protein